MILLNANIAKHISGNRVLVPCFIGALWGLCSLPGIFFFIGWADDPVSPVRAAFVNTICFPGVIALRLAQSVPLTLIAAMVTGALTLCVVFEVTRYIKKILK